MVWAGRSGRDERGIEVSGMLFIGWVIEREEGGTRRS